MPDEEGSDLGWLRHGANDGVSPSHHRLRGEALSPASITNLHRRADDLTEKHMVHLIYDILMPS